MRIRNRLATGAALLAVGAMVLTGCGSTTGSTTDGSKDKDTTAAQDDSNKKTDEKKDSAEPVTIEYWHRLPDDESKGMILVQTAADEFTKEHPNIKVKATKFQGKSDDSYQKISAAIKADNAPCLAQASYDGIPAMLIKGELQDVTAQAAKYKSEFAAGPWGQVSPGGKTFGIPQDTGPLVYYYNKAEFDKLGLKAPNTWDEYWQNAAKAKAAGKYASLFLKDDAGDWFGAIEAANGNTYYSLDGSSWKVDLASEKSLKVAEEWQKSIDNGTTLPVQRWNDDDFTAKLKDGKIIGYLGAAWEAAFTLQGAGFDKADWAVAQVPGGKSGPWGGSAIVVLKGCKHIDQALEFAAWYNSNLKAMVSQGLVPAGIGKVDTPEAIKKVYGGQDVLTEFAKAANNSNSEWAFSPTWPAVKKLINDSTGQGKNLVNTLKAAQKEAFDTLKAKGLPVSE